MERTNMKYFVCFGLCTPNDDNEKRDAWLSGIFCVPQQELDSVEDQLSVLFRRGGI